MLKDARLLIEVLTYFRVTVLFTVCALIEWAVGTTADDSIPANISIVLAMSGRDRDVLFGALPDFTIALGIIGGLPRESI